MSVDYEKLFKEHGDSPKALDWSPSGQLERFEALYEIGIGAADSVLDVGCGLGHFSDFLAEHGHSANYIGLDISGVMIDAARARNRSERSAFYVIDGLRSEGLPVADWVVSSGMLNVRSGLHPAWEYPPAMARLLMRRCFSAARKGLAINMLSAMAPKHRPDRNYYLPDIMLGTALELTPYVTLRHDYRENDFTLYLYKERQR